MREKGFTLIELMVTVTILAILAAVAIPLYNNYVYKSKTAEATTNISGIRTLQESWFAENNTYNIACCSGVNIAPAAWPTAAGRQRTGWVAGTDVANWAPLGFRPTGDSTYYQYGVNSTSAAARVTIAAMGDLDGDGNHHVFAIATGGLNNVAPDAEAFHATAIAAYGTIVEGGPGVW